MYSKQGVTQQQFYDAFALKKVGPNLCELPNIRSNILDIFADLELQMEVHLSKCFRFRKAFRTRIYATVSDKMQFCYRINPLEMLENTLNSNMGSKSQRIRSETLCKVLNGERMADFGNLKV